MSSKIIITSLLTSLQLVDQNQTDDPSSRATTTTAPHDTPLKQLSSSSHQEVKNVLLTLHFLFPHELLPALDLIDRRLITHLYTTPPDEPSLSPPTEVYYVQSSSTPTSTDTGPGTARQSNRFRNALARPGTSYEVRLDSWNCSCPAFALGALRLMMRNTGVGVTSGSTGDPDPGLEARMRQYGNQIEKQGVNEVNCEWSFGGIATRGDVITPVCKHILAVVLARAAPMLFGGGAISREVSREEMAAWAAGWGEH